LRPVFFLENNERFKKAIPKPVKRLIPTAPEEDQLDRNPTKRKDTPVAVMIGIT
jgi:hypothetical protein